MRTCLALGAAVLVLLACTAAPAAAGTDETCGIGGWQGGTATGFYEGIHWDALADNQLGFGYVLSRPTGYFEPGSWSVTVDFGDGTGARSYAGVSGPLPAGQTPDEVWIVHSYAMGGTYNVHVTASGHVNTISDGSGQDIPCSDNFTTEFLIPAGTYTVPPPGPPGQSCPAGFIGRPPHCINPNTIKDYCDTKNAWGKSKDERIALRAMAQFFVDAAGDGEDWANDVDLVGIALKQLAKVQLDPMAKLALDRAYAKLEEKLYDEYDLSREVVELGNQRRETIARGREAERKAGHLSRDVAQTNKKWKRAERYGSQKEQERLRKKFLDEAEELAKLRAEATQATRDTNALLTKISRNRLKLIEIRRTISQRISDFIKPIVDSRLAHEVVQFMRVFNLVGDVGTIWQYENEALARFLWAQAKKPNLNCNEPWSDQLPTRTTKPNLVLASPSLAPVDVFASRKRPLVPRLPALGAVASGVKGAGTINRVAAKLSADLPLLSDLKREAARSGKKGPSKELRALAKRMSIRLGAQPRLLKQVAAAARLSPQPITAQALGENRPRTQLKRIQRALKHFGADKTTIKAAGQGFVRPTPGAVLDLFGPVRDPAYAQGVARAAQLLMQL